MELTKIAPPTGRHQAASRTTTPPLSAFRVGAGNQAIAPVPSVAGNHDDSQPPELGAEYKFVAEGFANNSSVLTKGESMQLRAKVNEIIWPTAQGRRAIWKR